MLYGGPSQLETWDMKPDAPREIRGEYLPIRTNTPGRRVSEHLPHCAKILDRLAVVRSMTHTINNHSSAMYQAMVGRAPVKDMPVIGIDRTQDFPNYASTLTYLSAGRGPLPAVALPHVMKNVVDLPGQNAGFLGGAYDPMQIVGNPNQPNFRVRNLQTAIGKARVNERMNLRNSLASDTGIRANDVDQYQQRAHELLNSQSVSGAFDLKRESSKSRERYGRSKLGQSLLMARRLVESGVRFVNVHDGITNGNATNWDSHNRLFPRHRELLPPFDQGFSALIEDLEVRGLLDSTLVIAMGEFGRTPRINRNAGRDHWPNCYSLVMAGGGVVGGAVHGESDKFAALPESDPVSPGDIAATVFWRFGLDPRREIVDPLGRPFPIATGQPVKAIFS